MGIMGIRLASLGSAMIFRPFLLDKAGDFLAVGRRSPYFNMEERLRHRLYIRNLAEEVHRSVHEVAPLYEDVLAYFKAHAKVHDYLPILVSKKVKVYFKNGIDRPFGIASKS